MTMMDSLARRPRSRNVDWRRKIGMLLWIVFGLVSYGSLWMALIFNDNRSFTVISAAHQARKDLQQRVIKEGEAEKHQRREMEQTSKDPIIDKTRGRQRQTKSRSNHRNSIPSPIHDWSFWGLCICFAMMSIVRIQLEPSRRRRRIASIATNDDASVIQTLRRINRGRLERGEPLISFDAYQALRMALLQDRTLLQGLAGHHVPPPPRGATPEQIQSCQQLTITENDDYDGDCCICIASYQPGDQVRILPCGHSYHKECIDLWLEQSILCPICKQSLDDTEPDV